MKKKVILMVVIVAIIILIFFTGGFLTELFGNSIKLKSNITIEIEMGTSTPEIAKILKENGIVKNRLAFLLRLKMTENYGKLKYGKFEITTEMSKNEVIELLASEGKKKDTVRFTIPEGFSVNQIAVKLEEEGLCGKDEFIYVVKNGVYENYKFLQDIPEGVDYRLQGFLFPDTYEIYVDTTPEEIVDIMLKEFDKEFKEEYYNEINKLNKTIFEIVNMAALVEREAKLDIERSKISGVIRNRIDKKMKLQIDASVQYAITDGMYNVNKIYYKDLEVESEYNTYKYFGLPIGPICNPGIKSIEAAIYPEEHNYLYYKVTNETTGEHQFTETYSEHIQ